MPVQVEVGDHGEMVGCRMCWRGIEHLAATDSTRAVMRMQVPEQIDIAGLFRQLKDAVIRALTRSARNARLIRR